jgi:GT2 family glycosyltransferase
MSNNIDVSYIIGHKNRTELLEPNLQSLLLQTNKNFEIIITDNSDKDYKEKLKNIVSTYRHFGLSIKVFFIEPKLCKFSHDGSMFGNKYNPALQQNIAVKKSIGKVITLTSPEVINSCTNIENITNFFKNVEKKFLFGWINELALENIQEIIKNNYNNEHMKKYSELFPNLDGASCKPHAYRPCNYFLGSMLRKDYINIGGIDEEFMAAIAYEDDEFAQRCINNNFEILLNENIVGLHLSHSRSYQQAGRNINPYLADQKRMNKVANIGHDWGSNNCIIEEF